MGSCGETIPMPVKKDKNPRTGNPDLFEVEDQDLLMDNNEVKILRVRPEDPRAKGVSQFNGYVQRSAYVVMPKVDKLKAEKLMLKRQTDLRSERNAFTKMRIIDGGRDIVDNKNIYYINQL